MKKVVKASAQFKQPKLIEIIETLNGYLYKMKIEGSHVSEDTNEQDPDDVDYVKAQARNIKRLSESISSYCDMIINYKPNWHF